MEQKGMVFDIQRFALHDGPGIRTLVFLKGCPLSCEWCCNPESQSSFPQIAYESQKCISCNACISACPSGAVQVDAAGKRTFIMSLCADCAARACSEACPSGAIETLGREMLVSDVVASVSRDELFYRKSGGGVTLSGGEPLFQPEFSYEILKACKDLGYSTAVETSGYCRGENIERIADLTDLFLFDIKHLDGKKHKRFTGMDNELIMENLRRLSSRHAQLIVRIPLIPGFNDDTETLAGIADFAHQNHVSAIHVLPYHRLGRSKYERLAVQYRAEDLPLLTDGEIEAARTILEDRGVKVKLGG